MHLRIAILSIMVTAGCIWHQALPMEVRAAKEEIILLSGKILDLKIYMGSTFCR